MGIDLGKPEIIQDLSLNLYSFLGIFFRGA